MKIAFLFPGQGSQFKGMHEPFKTNKNFSELLKKANDILNLDLGKIMESDEINLTENAQPSIFVLSYFLAIEHSRDFDGEIFLAGHSLGEYTALTFGGAISFEDGVKLVRKRGEYMREATPPGFGSMFALMGDIKKVEEEIEKFDGVWIANINDPKQIVVSGKKDEVKKFVDYIKGFGIRAIELKVSAPFHCPLMTPAKENLRKYIDEEGIEFSKPKIPVISAHTLEIYDEIKETLLEGITGRVNWLGCIEKLLDLGVRKFVEFGPGKVLTNLTKRICEEMKIEVELITVN